MTVRILSLCVGIALCAPPVTAQQTYPSPKDPRIRFVDYDEHDIVKVFGKVGADTMIIFEDGEQIQDMSGGDTASWAVGVTKARNALFIKPSATSPATNMHVVTSRRVYAIDLKLAGRGQINYLTVQYRYPTQDAVRQRAVGEARRTRDALASGNAIRKNYRYSMQGASDLAPVAAWDDGVATFLRFAAYGSLPAVYTVGEDGIEHLVNTSMQEGALRIQTVAPKLILRSGDLVTCVFNDAYDAVGTRIETGTASPQVQRIVKEPKK